MANPIGLLLLGIVCSYIIGLMNRSSKVFFACVLALALGFVAGATTKKVISPLAKDNLAVVMIDNTKTGETSSMLCAFGTSIDWKPIARYSSMTSKNKPCGDILCSITPKVQTVHPVRCLSPPCSVYKGLTLLADYDTS